VPSVVSNLGVGVLLGSGASGADFSWPWLLMIAAVLFYVAGNFFNDWQDREWDRVNRPERALPRGMFSANVYLAAAVGGAVIGLCLTAVYGFDALLIAAVLVGLIWLYTKVHKKAAWSVIPMGLCRACLPVLGYVALSGEFEPGLVLLGLGLFVYIVGLSLSARWESRAEVPVGKKLLSRILLITAGVVPIMLLKFVPAIGWIGMVAFFLWLGLCLTKYRSPVPAHVSALLAGIPLVDWVVLFPMSCIWLSLGRVEATDPMFIIAVFLPPVAFVLGRALQRLAPAT
jgi:heme O synthase-like polyprenyltransferase